jgi:hypothetical protein
MPSSPHAQANPTAVRPQSSGNELLAVPKRHVLADRVLCATPYERQHRRWLPTGAIARTGPMSESGSVRR